MPNPEALDAIRLGIKQPFVETWTGMYSKYYLGCSCAVFAASQGDSARASEVCDYMETAGKVELYWAPEIAAIRAAIKTSDRTIGESWRTGRGWPNLFNSNSTDKDNASVLYPTTWPNPERPR